MAKRPQFIPPPQELRRKAVNYKRGVSLQLEPEVMKRLEAVVEKATDTFTMEVAEKLKQLRATLAELPYDGTAALAPMKALRSTSLEVKGMGGMFKYPLLTAFAKSLNDFTQDLDAPNAVQRDIIAAQIDALYVVMANRIQGGGGAIERELLDALNTAIRKYKS